MLIQFGVENFRSIKEYVILSLKADRTDSMHESILINKNDELILPVVSIYGANAAGKSNIIKALDTAIKIIKFSESRQFGTKLHEIVPFMLDEESKYKPTSFDFIFLFDDVKYRYGFTANVDRIVDEYLYIYHSVRPSKIFERKNTNDFTFGQSYSKELNPIISKTTDNKLFLSTATIWNATATKKPFTWFMSKIEVIQSGNLEHNALILLEQNKDNLKEFLLNSLKEADLNIGDFSFKSQNVEINDLQTEMFPPGLLEFFEQNGGFQGPFKKYEINTSHLITNETGEKKWYSLPLEEESAGTQKMFYLIAVLNEAVSEGKTVIIDEIEISLHPKLVEFIVSMYQYAKINKNQSQLIFTTHNVSLLTLKIFRRDQIYFVEKSHLNANTDLYSLDEFSPRKNENIRKGYLQGKYGAIPIVYTDIEDTLW